MHNIIILILCRLSWEIFALINCRILWNVWRKDLVAIRERVCFLQYGIGMRNEGLNNTVLYLSILPAVHNLGQRKGEINSGIKHEMGIAWYHTCLKWWNRNWQIKFDLCTKGAVNVTNVTRTLSFLLHNRCSKMEGLARLDDYYRCNWPP